MFLPEISTEFFTHNSSFITYNFNRLSAGGFNGFAKVDPPASGLLHRFIIFTGYLLLFHLMYPSAKADGKE